MPLGPGEEFRFIPLHNGYMYLLIKTVIVGLLWFALFILQQVLSGFQPSNQDSGNAHGRAIVLWSCMVFLFTQPFRMHPGMRGGFE